MKSAAPMLLGNGVGGQLNMKKKTAIIMVDFPTGNRNQNSR